ncbi:MAG: GspH/FimT family pseudopilin [Candidatus Omnitrophota bacterium]
MRGITLVEILVVLFIISAMFGMSLMLFAGFGNDLKLNAAAREIASVLRTARSYAISHNAQYSVEFPAGGNEFWISRDGNVVERRYRLPANINRKSGPDQIEFRATGSSDGETFELSCVKDKTKDTVIDIVVAPVTGRVRIGKMRIE